MTIIIAHSIRLLWIDEIIYIVTMLTANLAIDPCLLYIPGCDTGGGERGDFPPLRKISPP